MKKVLEVNVDDLYFGGVYSLIKNIIKHKNNKLEIDIAAIEEFQNHENINELERYNTHVYYVGCKGNKIRKQFVVYSKLKQLLRKKQYDCIHIHADVANKLFVSGLAAKHAGVKKIIFHSHASGVDGKYRRLKIICHKFCSIFLKSIGNEFVACSDLAGKWMFPYINESYIKIINNGIELNNFRFDSVMRDKVRKKLNLTNELIIGHVGRFAYQKNHEYLVEIMKRFNEKGVNVRLLMIGDGPEKEKVYHLIKKKRIEEMFIFYGKSNHVNKLLQAMDIFVLPSHFEGFPIVGIEAQAAGLPTLFSEKISKGAKLSRYVRFIPIKKENIDDWVENIKCFGELNIRRDRVYDELKLKKFDITDTVNSFCSLYMDC